MKRYRYNNWMTARWRDSLRDQAKLADPNTTAAIEQQLATAIVVAPEDILEGRVQFGSLVTVFSVDEEEEQSFQIVSREESISQRNLLDASTPLAQALFGAREGDVVTVTLANGSNCDYEVTHIRVPLQ